MSQTGRKPKAKVKPGTVLEPWVLDVLLGREDDASLVWSVSRADIVRAVQTVGGIAALAGVHRKTVCRLGIAPNSMHAAEFVRNCRLADGKPLVWSRSEPILPPDFIRIRDAIRTLQRLKFATQIEQRDDAVRPVVDHELPTDKATKWKGKRGVKYHEIKKSTPDITPELRERFRRFVYYYEMPKFKVSVRQIYSLLRWSPAWFYERFKRLPVESRAQLRKEMSGDLCREWMARPTDKPDETATGDPFFEDRDPEQLAVDKDWITENRRG